MGIWMLIKYNFHKINIMLLNQPSVDRYITVLKRVKIAWTGILTGIPALWAQENLPNQIPPLLKIMK